MHRRVRALLTMRVVLVLIAAGHAAAALAVIGYAGWGLWDPFSRRSDVAIVVPLLVGDSRSRANCV